MLVSRSGSSVSRLATISLMAEFFAPEIGDSPVQAGAAGDRDTVHATLPPDAASAVASSNPVT